MGLREMLPTDENLIEAFEKDLPRRNFDVVDFYKFLLADNGYSAIALDGPWGSGKTFFVKQTMLLIQAKNEHEEMNEAYRERVLTMLRQKEKNNAAVSARAVYFDAWKNDNDIDPLLSLLCEIFRQLQVSNPLKSKGIKITKLIVSVIKLYKGLNLEGLLDAIENENPLSAIEEQHKLESLILQFFKSVFSEWNFDKLIIFVDELDRCKPSFAVHLLEQIKHYFVLDKVLFVFSVNMAELQHTIKHCYGNEFDAWRYIDRFFDLRLPLPSHDLSLFYSEIGLDQSRRSSVVKNFINRYGLTMREISKFSLQVNSLWSRAENRSLDETEAFLVNLIVPIVIGLGYVGNNLRTEFLEGRNSEPMTATLNDSVFDIFVRQGFPESVSREECIKQFYDAIFNFPDIEGSHSYQSSIIQVGKYEISERSKDWVLSVAGSLLKNTFPILNTI